MSQLELDPNLPQIDDLLSIFLNDAPLLDVRAPVEFAEGAFPLAKNHPLITDNERHNIGIKYKEEGQDAAIALGAQFMDETTRAERVSHWQTFAEQHPAGILYCFRGGMRSKISQQWLFDQTGTRYPRVNGGYKALRRFLLDQLAENAQLMHPVILGGRTGVGKTVLLNKLTPSLDLEGIAWHRGSAFGKHATPQPTQISFENALSIELLKLVHQGNPYFVSEDESRNIGIRHMPAEFYEPFSKAPIVVLEASIDERIAITEQEYVGEALAEFQALYGDEKGYDEWEKSIHDNLDRIQKRLGGERYREQKTLLESATQEHRKHGKSHLYQDWIRVLLVDYYDSMYGYQLEKKKDRIVFSGNATAAREYLATEHQIVQKD